MSGTVESFLYEAVAVGDANAVEEILKDYPEVNVNRNNPLY